MYTPTEKLLMVLVSQAWYYITENVSRNCEYCSSVVETETLWSQDHSISLKHNPSTEKRSNFSTV